ncbi:MAG: Uma2 family endonuclease [Planctomycetales bacterium]|nr:Uma2 family endonuclease [Planctomycetales bacterium]
MQMIVEIAERQEQLALNRRRWRDLMSDTALAELPFRIETNAHGQIIMNPPPSGVNSYRQSQILLTLRDLIGGQPLAECPLSTLDGVKAVDVGWYSDQRFELVRHQELFEIAPEICIDLLSPGNTATEITHKKKLYFDSGASEVWLCLLTGAMEFYLDSQPEVSQRESRLGPEFPSSF